MRGMRRAPVCARCEPEGAPVAGLAPRASRSVWGRFGFAGEGGTGSQPAERGTAGQRLAHILDIVDSGRLTQPEALAMTNACGLHQVGDELVLDALGDDHRPAYTSERHGGVHSCL